MSKARKYAAGNNPTKEKDRALLSLTSMTTMRSKLAWETRRYLRVYKLQVSSCPSVSIFLSVKRGDFIYRGIVVSNRIHQYARVEHQNKFPFLAAGMDQYRIHLGRACLRLLFLNHLSMRYWLGI